MDAVLALLVKRRWDTHCRRTNIATPADIEGTTFRRARLMSNKLRANETELRFAIQKIAPEWHSDTQVIVNKNVTCARHRDGANNGASWVLWLGDFTGGALLFEDGSRLEGARQWHRFAGQTFHWNEPHTGDKYAVVLYRPTKPSCAELIARRKKQNVHAKARAGAAAPTAALPPGGPPADGGPAEPAAAGV